MRMKNLKQSCHSIRLSSNSIITRLKQKYDITLMAMDKKMIDNIEELEKSLFQLTNMLLKN